MSKIITVTTLTEFNGHKIIEIKTNAGNNEMRIKFECRAPNVEDYNLFNFNYKFFLKFIYRFNNNNVRI